MTCSASSWPRSITTSPPCALPTRAREHLPPRKSTAACAARGGRSTSLHAQSAGADGYPPQPDRRGRAVRLAAHSRRTCPKRGRSAMTAGKANGLRPAPASITGQSMFHTPAAGHSIIGSPGRRRGLPGPLLGWGPTSMLGGRYHRPHQRTVYASEDALVAITEMAYYQALELKERIGGGRTATPMPPPRPTPPAYPLVSSYLLWVSVQCTAAGHRPRRSECLHHVSARADRDFQHRPGLQRHPVAGRPHSHFHLPPPPARLRGSRHLPPAHQPRAATSPRSTPCS